MRRRNRARGFAGAVTPFLCTIFSALLAAAVLWTVRAALPLQGGGAAQSAVPRGGRGLTTAPSAEEQELLDWAQQGQQVLPNRYRLLLVGIDHTRRLADVILYAQVDFDTHTAQVLQIPRDLFVGQQYQSGKINSACRSFESDDPTADIAALLEHQLGLPVDGAAAITLAGVRALVDGVGGVPITLAQPIRYLPGKTLAAGAHVLDGEQAEWLLRCRNGYEMGDLDRQKVQQQFLQAALQAAKSIGRLQALRLAATGMGHIKTTVPMEQIGALVSEALAFSPQSITMQTIPVYGAQYGEYEVLCVNRHRLAALLNEGVRRDDPVDPWQLYLAYPPAPAEPQIEPPLFDFSWSEDIQQNEPLYDAQSDAEGIVLRNNREEAP